MDSVLTASEDDRGKRTVDLVFGYFLLKRH